MVSIRPSMGGQSAFQPNELDAMSKAFDDVCERMKLTPDQTDQREILAEQIIDLARSGVTNPEVLLEMLSAPRSGL